MMDSSREKSLPLAPWGSNGAHNSRADLTSGGMFIPCSVSLTVRGVDAEVFGYTPAPGGSEMIVCYSWHSVEEDCTKYAYGRQLAKVFARKLKHAALVRQGHSAVMSSLAEKGARK